MLPGRNLEALRSIGLKGGGWTEGGRQTDAEEEREDGWSGQTRWNTKTRNEESIGRRLEVADDRGSTGEGGRGGGRVERARKSENGLTRVWFMGPRRRGCPFAVERCSYPEIMSGLHLPHPRTSSFLGCRCRSPTVVRYSVFPFPSPCRSAIVRQIERADKRRNELIGDLMTPISASRCVHYAHTLCT